MADFPEQKSVGFSLSFELFQAETSLLNFLLIRLAQHHREQLAELLAQGCVQVDQAVVLQDQALQQGQIISLRLPEHWEDRVDERWHLLWENSELMAVYKPHLLPVSRTTRNLYHTLISLIRRETPYPEAHLLHRLDTETAGIVLIAKHSDADKKWKPNLDQLITRKVYHAWVEGQPSWGFNECECLLSTKQGSPIRSQMYVVDAQSNVQHLKPKQSKTFFRVLRREPGRTLIECELKTGRKHQIRAQLAHLGHPIIGDKVYSHQGRYYLKRLQHTLTAQDFERLGGEYHLLCATRLELQIGLETVRIHFESPT